MNILSQLETGDQECSASKKLDTAVGLNQLEIRPYGAWSSFTVYCKQATQYTGRIYRAEKLIETFCSITFDVLLLLSN